MNYYNVWMTYERRWTNHDDQDPNDPKQLSYDAAEKVYKYLKDCGCKCEILPLTVKSVGVVNKIAASTVTINDHICPHCKNDRVSKTEKSCWRCGGSL